MLFLLLNGIASISDGVSIGTAVTSFAISIGVVVAGEVLWRATRPRS